MTTSASSLSSRSLDQILDDALNLYDGVEKEAPIESALEAIQQPVVPALVPTIFSNNAVTAITVSYLKMRQISSVVPILMEPSANQSQVIAAAAFEQLKSRNSHLNPMNAIDFTAYTQANPHPDDVFPEILQLNLTNAIAVNAYYTNPHPDDILPEIRQLNLSPDAKLLDSYFRNFNKIVPNLTWLDYSHNYHCVPKGLSELSLQYLNLSYSPNAAVLHVNSRRLSNTIRVLNLSCALKSVIFGDLYLGLYKLGAQNLPLQHLYVGHIDPLPPIEGIPEEVIHYTDGPEDKTRPGPR